MNEKLTQEQKEFLTKMYTGTEKRTAYHCFALLKATFPDANAGYLPVHRFLSGIQR